MKMLVVNGFENRELKQWADKNLQTGTTAASGGLACFRSIQEARYKHRVCIVGNSRDLHKTAPLNWVSTILENLKTALAGTFHKRILKFFSIALISDLY